MAGGLENHLKPITLGVYINNLYALDTEKDTFNADLWVWTRSDKNIKYNLADSLDINYENSLNPQLKSDYSSSLLDKRTQYQEEKISGNFIHEFHMENYPFDHQILSINFEDSNFDINDLQFVSDPATSMNQDIKLEGWKINGFKVKELPHPYSTNFGDITKLNSNIYSQIMLLVDISRDSPLLFIKETLPLYIAVILALCACFMPISNAEIFSGRMLMIGTAIFVAVLNQQSVGDKLGHFNVITLIDKIHIIGLVCILILLAQAIITRYLHEKEYKHTLLHKIDMYTFVIGLLSFLSSTSYLIYSAYEKSVFK